MDCVQLRKAILDGASLAAPAAQHHLMECPACQALAEGGGDLARFMHTADPPAATSPPSLDDVERALAREDRFAARLKGLPTPVRGLLAAVALLIPVVMGPFRLRPDLALYPTMRFLAEMVALAALAGATAWLWLRPMYRPPLPSWLVPGLVALALLLPWLLAALPPAHAYAQQPWPAVLHQASGCFLMGSAIALPAIFVLAGVGRRRQGSIGFALLPALVAALASLIGLQLHCPITAPAHLLVGHAPIAWTLSALLLLALGIRNRAP